MPRGCGERLRYSRGTGGMPEGPLESAGLQRLLVVLEGEPLEELLTQLSLGASQPAEVSQVVCLHLFGKSHLLIQEVVSLDAPDMRVCAGRTQGIHTHKHRFRLFFRIMAASLASGFDPTHGGVAPACLERRCGRHTGFASSDDAQG